MKVAIPRKSGEVGRSRSGSKKDGGYTDRDITDDRRCGTYSTR